MRLSLQFCPRWIILLFLYICFSSFRVQGFIVRQSEPLLSSCQLLSKTQLASSTFQEQTSVENLFFIDKERSTLQINEDSYYDKEKSSKLQANKAFEETLRSAIAGSDSTLSIKEKEGVRGLYLNRLVQSGEVILRVPLSACLRDDQPPAWFSGSLSFDDGRRVSGWATRLAASLIEKQLLSNDENKLGFLLSTNRKLYSVSEITKQWLSLLPNPEVLRASLPVHWSTSVLQSAECTALELAADSAFFNRAEAIEDLMQGLQTIVVPEHFENYYGALRRLCDDALDVVQTRSCRVVTEAEDWASVATPLRLVAPIFDCINHDAAPNARFALEQDGSLWQEQYLVVRMLCDLEAGTEVFIDYGESTRPDWKCLSSYGFLPTYDETQNCNNDDDLHVAEVLLNGKRYEVGPTFVPQDMVVAMRSALPSTSGSVTEEADEARLTPDIANALSRCISTLDDVNGASTGNDHPLDEIVSAELATALRLKQHRIRKACSRKLQEWAADPRNAIDSSSVVSAHEKPVEFDRL